MTVDPYLDPESGVLRNRLGIIDAARLRQAEADLSQAALAELGIRSLPGRYDLDHLCAFHREIFGDVYPWAGEIRVVGIAKSDPFCLPRHIESYAAEVFAALMADRFLRGLDRTEFVGKLTHYLAEVNAIHPFREGNGRAQRAFFGQLARESGWMIDWTGLDPDENAQASMASLRGDNGPLRGLLDSLVRRYDSGGESR
ncbi:MULTISPECIES: Fic family protein [unclassified Nocardia]|uniref:Fic/DOC family protein n=1 Tax=unclassified Nocardia TaxID=2637762 RepID=UPI0024A8C805|nr:MULTISPECIES: Fic family protein [unclassified Nocardia]